MAPLDLFADDDLVVKAAAYAKSYMSHYDASHDWSHILRVLSLAHSVWESERGSLEPSSEPLRKVTLAALLHDVGDKKYLGPSEDGTTLVRDFLVASGAADASLATAVQEICLGVSYSSEMKDPAKVRALIAKHPELAIVQDADRLDAIGAVGVGRCFAFGAAKGGDRGMQGSVDHFGEKLLKLEGLMKTETGRKMAKVRTERLRIFEEWWKLENADVI